MPSSRQQPAWDTIQSKSKEYSELASQLGKHDPVRGDKDSWSKLTLAFAESAAGLDKSAQAKDKQKTQESLDSLGSSCMACHRQHRVMGPGGGRPGMGGPRPGMPPGGPGGPPPGLRAGRVDRLRVRRLPEITADQPAEVIRA